MDGRQDTDLGKENIKKDIKELKKQNISINMKRQKVFEITINSQQKVFIYNKVQWNTKRNRDEGDTESGVLSV